MASSQDTNPDQQDDSLFMCLKCRQVGHIFNDCPNPWFQEVWITSQSRKQIDYGEFPELLHQPLCQRCQDLDLLDFLYQELPWNSMLFLSDQTVRESGCLRNIGQVGTIIFRENCSLCRCLFTLTPEPETPTDNVLLFPCWTMCRLEGAISMDTPEKAKYARCLHIVLDPTLRDQIASSAERQDGLCLLEEDRIDPESSLGARLIDPRQMDFKSIEKWLSLCSKLHPITCPVLWHEELQTINLIDVHSRKIVKYPEEKCNYLALSYVWGGVNQNSYKLGQILGILPQTIEDAITFTLKLKKRYLWVDSICIDQSDEAEKLRQIGIMNLIYEGADATVIAFSSQSANSGLPRMSPGNSMTPQMKTVINGKRLVGLSPTLSQSIWISSWGNRAWTMQEALLSRRCIYLGSDQVLFECNAMQCSESLDESRSWVHNTFRDEKFIQNQSATLIGAGVLHSPFVATQKSNERLQHYSVLANLYSFRNLTFDGDAINGFSGIVQYMTRLAYAEGFFWGLPIEDLNWALGWNVQWWGKRRAQFPSWTWAGWKSRLVELEPFDVKKPHQFPVYFKAWKLSDEKFTQLLILPKRDDPEVEKLQENSLLQKFTEESSTDLNFNITTLSKLEQAQSLFIEGIVVTFKPDYNQPRNQPDMYGEFQYFDMELSGIGCLLRVIFRDPILEDEELKKCLRCLLLAIDQNETDHFYHFLVLKRNEEVFERQSMITIQTSRDSEDLLNHAEAKKERIILK